MKVIIDVMNRYNSHKWERLIPRWRMRSSIGKSHHKESVPIDIELIINKRCLLLCHCVGHNDTVAPGHSCLFMELFTPTGHLVILPSV